MKIANYKEKRLIRYEYFRRGLSLLLCLVMVLSMLPLTTAAEQNNGLYDAEHTVSDWTWEDSYDVLLSGADYGLDDVEWVLRVPERTDDVLQTLLPSEIAAVTADGTARELPVEWALSEPQEYKQSFWKRLFSFGSNTLSDGLEQDTVWVYTNMENNSKNKKAGEIVKDNEGNPIMNDNKTKDDKPDGEEAVSTEAENDEENDIKDALTRLEELGLTVGKDVELTKIYNTAEGLHTDKTAEPAGEDGHTFNVDLEAWYAEGEPIHVGMVLDASGSMNAAMDKPTQIVLDEETISELNIKKLTKANAPTTTTEWNEYFLTDKQLDEILNPHKTDNSLLTTSGYSRRQQRYQRCI